LIRFHYIGLHREWFGDRIIAEMAAPITPDSRNTLWEYLGRRFINLEYSEADQFCRHSKEFVTSLFPKGEIYASLLPPEARNLIGKVSPEAEPAKAMLEALGFSYIGHCDPFDGGPYLEASLAKIPLVLNTRIVKVGAPVREYPMEGFISFTGSSGFRAVRTRFANSKSNDEVCIPQEQAELIGANIGDIVAITPRSSAQPTSGSSEQKNRTSSRASLPAPASSAEQPVP
jgi:arginine N-succinyltransferase